MKSFYYKHLFFRKVPHKWHKDYVETKYRGIKIKYLLYQTKGEGYSCPKFLNENLSTLHNEMGGYFYSRDIMEGDYVLDCGSYNGAFAVYACKKAGPSGFVICIEPDKENAKILEKNLQLNECKNFIIVQKGLWNKEDTLRFKSKGIGAKISSKGDVEIKTISIDLLLKKLKINIERINFIKMDIEGAEIKALEGAESLLSKSKPYIAIASYHILDGKKTFSKIEESLNKFGYKKVETVFPRHLTTIGSI
ncbi:MAG: FkbM family methyltransferase [Nanoarchaeota archaeon]|nr:FkbM family methyltransferase [Nanoarchaeota archaeon]